MTNLTATMRHSYEATPHTPLEALTTLSQATYLDLGTAGKGSKGATVFGPK